MNWADIAIRVRALIRIWANQGMPTIPVWAARMRMGSPYVYGVRKISLYAYGQPLRIWDGPYAYGKNTCMGRNITIIGW